MLRTVDKYGAFSVIANTSIKINFCKQDFKIQKGKNDKAKSY